MKGLLPLTKCVLLALTLLFPATHGRAHPWRRQQQQQQQQQQDSGYQPHYGYSRLDDRLPGHGRLTNPYKTYYSSPDLLRQLFESLSDRLDPLDASLEESPLSNDLDQNLALSPEDVAPYTTRHMDTYQGHGRDRTRHQTYNFQNYHTEVCATHKEWNVLTETVDLNGNAVVIIQLSDKINQTFFSYTCNEPCQSCKNVTGNSRCKQRFTYVRMYHYRKDSPSTKLWDFVEVPSHCACELVPPHIPDMECSSQ